jgi:two-component system chemotaxis response regulator CheY
MSANTPKTRVLIVDDAPTVRLYHGSILSDAGYAVTEAANGLEALEASLTSPHDLYVVDVNMPKMDGYSFVSALRAQVRSGAPVIMISTEGDDRDAAAAYAAGANVYLVKPVAAAHLIDMADLLTGRATVLR